VRWSQFNCNLPLLITDARLKGDFEIIDWGRVITDAAFES
jgi:hypothetical protein